MIRGVALLIISVIAVAAIAASDRQKPLLVDNQSSGEWAFNNADAPVINDDAHIWLQICDPIRPFSPPTNFVRPKKVQQV